MTLHCATGNAGKLREFHALAANRNVNFEMLPEFSRLPPCEETGATFEQNAVLKAGYYSLHASGLLFADDSGLEVEALGGGPGVRSARFAGPRASDEANNRLLLERLRGVSDRRARFVCVIALARAGKVVRTFHGAVEGFILDEPRGANGFGYDPLFFYAPFGCSFGEASPECKLAVSHRGQALRAMLDFLGPGL